MVSIFNSVGRLFNRSSANRTKALKSTPVFMMFDGKSFAPVNTTQRRADFYSGYGMSAAILRPGKLMQTDTDLARGYVQCEYAFRAIEMVASDIASIKHGVRNRQTKEDMPTHPLMLALAWARRELHQDILSLWQKALYVYGECYLMPTAPPGFLNPETGLPFYNGLQWLNPLITEPYVVGGKLIDYRYSAYGVQTYQPNQIVFDRVSSMFDDLRGQSRMSAALASVNIDIEIKRYTLDSFLKDMRMQGILTGREGSMLEQKDVDGALEVIKQQRDQRLIGLAPALVWQQVQHEWDDTQFKASDDARRRITTALGIPMSVVGAWDDAKYQSAPAQLAFYYDHVVFRECDRITQFINDVLMPYFDPRGEGEWYYDRDSVLTLIEDKAAKSTMYSNEWKEGGRMLNEYREAIGLQPVEGGEVFNINGQIISKAQLAQMYTNVVMHGSVLPPDALAATPQLPAPVAPPIEDKAVEPTEQPGMKSAFIGLTFPNHPDLMGLQSRVKELVGPGECVWNAPDDFHITLAYAPAVSDEQLAALTAGMEELDVPDMALRVGSLGVFDNLGQHAVHFKIRRNTDLLAFQAELHKLCKELGIQMSSFSDPAQYKPHITMGNAKDKLPPITFKSALKIKPATFCLKSGDELLHETALGDVPIPPVEPDEPEPPAQKAVPADVPADEAPTEPIEVQNIEPDPPSQAVVDEVFQQLAAEEGITELEIVPGGPSTLPPADGTEHEAAPVENPVAVAGDTLTTEPQTIEAKALDELAAWRKKVKNKGAAKALDFQTYLVRDEIAEPLRAALSDPELSEEAIASAFETAQKALAVKTIDATRSAFVEEIQAAMQDGVDRVVSKASTAARIRGAITRYGTLAYQDGMQAGGVDGSELTEDDTLKIKDLNVADSQYVSDLVNEIYSAPGMSGTPASRAPLWGAKTLNAFYYAGLGSADANGMYEFTGHDGEESCTDCKRLKGQRHRMKDWEKKKMRPQKDTASFDCGGWRCEHELTKVSGKARGSW